jgi:hypothetical protein
MNEPAASILEELSTVPGLAIKRAEAARDLDLLRIPTDSKRPHGGSSPMKRSTPLTLAALALAFVFGFATRAYTAEPHPELLAADQALHKALNHLEKAAHDFGGHRMKAAEYTRAALSEISQAYAFDH